MRNLSKILAVVSFVLIAGIAIGQDAKFGHIDFQAVVQLMPERTKAEADYAKHAEELEEQMMVMQKEYETKLNEYIQKRDSLSEIVRSARESDIQDLQQRIQNFPDDCSAAVATERGRSTPSSIRKSAESSSGCR
jgi:outer membrane protein